MRALLLALLMSLTVGVAAAQAPAAPARIRTAFDGPGPSHLFWLRAQGREADVIGVADPLFAAVRFYALRRGTGPVAERLRPLGACALPIDFRVWQVHQRRGEVVLEGQPDVPWPGHNVTSARLKTTAIRIPRTLTPAALAVDQAGWDPARASACGPAARGRLGALAPYRARRLDAGTIVLAGAGGPLTVRARPGGRLYGAQELEPAGRLRVVRTSEGLAGDDGMVRIVQRLDIFGPGGRLQARRRFDETGLRGKLPQRPLAVTPAGEVLVMGQPEGGAFGLMSCGTLGQPQGPCRYDAAPAPPTPVQPAVFARTAGHTGDAAAIFGRVKTAATLAWSVDAGALPGECRAADGCRTAGQEARFTPIAGLRLTRGLYRRTGLPYAQSEAGIADADRFAAASPQALARALKDAREGRGGLPGNLADSFTGDLGIDCSALIQMAWGGGGEARRLSTRQLQTAPVSYGCPSRLPGPQALRAGDAIALNLPGVLEHAVLFAEPLSPDGASEAWLVLEASGGCGGVCWSLYDPAFFNGWGLYRAAGRSDSPCPAGTGQPGTGRTGIATAAIPAVPALWRRRLSSP